MFFWFFNGGLRWQLTLALKVRRTRYFSGKAGSFRGMQGANSPCRKYGLVPVGVLLRYTLVLARNVRN